MNLIEEENKKQPSPEGAEALSIAEKKLDELYNVDETAEVETVVNTIGGAVDVAQLGVEISETQKNSIDYWVGVLEKDENKTVDQVEKEDSEEKLQALTIIYNAVAVDLIGSYWDSARQDLAPEWKTDGFDIIKFSNQVKPQVVDISKLDSSKLSADNLLLLKFLQKDSQLTNDIKKNIYPKLVVEQEKQMVEMFTAYNTFLKKTPEDQEKEKGIFKKTIAAVEKDRDKMTSKETPTEDKVKTGLKYAGIAVGGRLAIRAIRRGWNSLFGSKDKKEASEDSSSSRWKRALGIGGGALVLWLLGKRDDSKKENGEVDPGLPGTVPNEGEILDYLKTVPTEQQTLATLAVQGINGMYQHDEVGTDTFGESSFESASDGSIAPGLLIAILQERHGNVNELLTSSTYYQELLGADVNIMWQEMKKIAVKPLQALGAAVLQPLGDTIVGEFLKKNTVDKMVDYLQEQGVKVETIHQVLRKNLSIMSYVNLKKNQLEEVIASKYLAANDKKRSTYSDDRKRDEIDDMINNEELYKQHIEPSITSYGMLPLIDLTGNRETFLSTLSKEGILDESLPAETQEQVDRLNEDFTEMYECEEFDNHSLFEIDPFENGTLTVEGKASLEEVIGGIEEHMGDAGKAGFFKSYLPILTLLSTAENTEQEILTQYEPLMRPYVEALTTAKTKIADGTFSSTDFEEVKELAQSYKTLNTQRQLTNRSITEVKQENGGTAVTIGNIAKLPGQLWTSAKEGGDKFWNQGLTLLFTGDTRTGWDAPLKVGDSVREIAKGGAQLGGTLLSAELALRLPRRGLTMVGVGRAPSTPQLLKLPLKGLRRAGAKAGEKISKRITPARYYKGREKLFVYDLMHDNISLERGTRVAQKLGIQTPTELGKTIILDGDTRGLLRNVFGSNLTDEQADIVAKYRGNPHIRSQLLSKTWSGSFRNKRNENKTSFELRPDSLKSLGTINKSLDAIPSIQEKQILESMLARSKNITVAENITSRRNELFKLLRKNPVGTTLTPESFFAHRKISPKELGRVLAKVNSVDEIPKVMAFIEESAKAGKITNNATFFKKSFLLRETIKADPHAQNQRLNGASRLKTAVEKMDVKGKLGRLGALMEKAKDRMKLKLRNPTSPFPQAALAEANRYDHLFDDAAKNPANIVRAMQELGENINITAGQLSRSSSQQVESIKRFLRMNPKAMKFVRGAMVGVGIIVGAVEAYGSYTHAQELIETNPEKADVYIDKALTEAGLVTVGAAALFIPGPGWVVAGTIGIVEGGAWIAKDTYFDVMDAYTTNKNDWIKKGTEAKQEALLHFLSITLGDSGIERSGKESFTRYFSGKDGGEFSELASKTGDEAMAAWLLMDEIERDPTGIGLIHFIGRDKEDEIIQGLPKDSEAVAARAGSVQTILHSVEKRAEYIKSKIGTKEIAVKEKDGVDITDHGAVTRYKTTKTQVLNRKSALEQQGAKYGVHSFIHQQLNESRLSLQESTSFHDGKTNQKRLEELNSRVMQDSRYPKLKEQFDGDREQLLYHMYCGHDLITLYDAVWPEGAQKSQAKNNLQYLGEFLECTSWKKGRDISTVSFASGELVYDQTRIKNFLQTLVREDAHSSSISSESRAEVVSITDSSILERFGKTPNVLQNVLYDIATQVFGMHIENNLQVLESIFTEANSERYGLYFDKEGKYIRATDTSGFDYKKLSMAPDQQLASLKQLRDSVYGAVTTGKGELITTQTNSGRKLLNQEVGGAYLRIMDRYYNQLFIQEKNSVVPAYSRLLFDIDKCADGTKGEWFELPHETIMTGMMLGVQNMGTYLYRQREDGQYEVRSKDGGEKLLSVVYPNLK